LGKGRGWMKWDREEVGEESEEGMRRYGE